MKNINHFIITQFNLRLWSKDKNNRSTYTDQWLSDRFDLFEKYCLPSVEKQTCKDFIWICLFDSGTDQKYISRIEGYSQRVRQLKTWFLDEEQTVDWLEYVKNKMVELINDGDGCVITTNLDNDDSIHMGMVEKLHSLIPEQMADDKLLLSFNYGYQYFPDQKIILKMKYPHNHFLSLAEKVTSGIRTVKACPHAQARKLYKTIDLKTPPYWIEIVHGANVNNDLRITSRVKNTPVVRSVDMNEFGIDRILPWYGNLWGSFISLPVLYARIGTKRLKKKLNKKK